MEWHHLLFHSATADCINSKQLKPVCFARILQGFVSSLHCIVPFALRHLRCTICIAPFGLRRIQKAYAETTENNSWCCQASNSTQHQVFRKMVDCLKFNKKPRYQKDDRTMHPIYECPENCVWAQNQLTIAQESPHYNFITIWQWNYFQSVPTSVIRVPKRCRQTDTDGQYTVASPRGKTGETKCCRYYWYCQYL